MIISNRTRHALGLVGWLLLCFAVAALASQFNPDAWFAALNKPSWNPPNTVFAPVWTLLYALMGVAAWLVWKQAGFDGAGAALGLFVVQLLVNGSWSWMFFGRHQIGVALIIIVVLWGLIVMTILRFRLHSRPAALLLAPYLAWVSFAAALNAAFWMLNR